MAGEPHENGERPDDGRSGSARNALRTAAVAAATTAGAAAVRQALTKRSSGDGGGKSGGGSGESPLSVALQSAWEAARDHLIPPAEEAMDAIGRYLAEDAPEILRERLVPRLVEAFENAREDEGGSSRAGD